MDFDKQLLNLEHEIYRNSFAPFVKNTVPNYIDGYYLNDYFFQIQQFYDDVLQGKSPRLIINMPPRHLKSETATIRLPLFAMLNNPRFEVIIASANQDLSNKFSRISRDLVEHEYIKKYWNNISVNKKLKNTNKIVITFFFIPSFNKGIKSSLKENIHQYYPRSRGLRTPRGRRSTHRSNGRTPLGVV